MEETRTGWRGNEQFRLLENTISFVEELGWVR